MEIILPARAEQPVYRCLICDAGFYRDQHVRWQRHLTACAKEHLDELRAQAPSAKHAGTMWSDEYGDPELEKHFRKVRKTMESEGRMEIKPHETGGF